MLTIGFYSIGTPYEQEARTFVASLDRVGMPHRVTGYESRGDWYANTAAKAELIREARHSIRGPLLYIDVDAYVHQNCEPYFDGLAVRGYDFGVHWFAGPAKGRKRRQVCACVRDPSSGGCSQEHRLLSGTLFFGDTDGALRLVDAWVDKNAEMRARGVVEGGGQKNLWRTVVSDGAPEGADLGAHMAEYNERFRLKSLRPTLREWLVSDKGYRDTLKIARLPGRYCRVFDKPWAYPGKEPVIIEHTIASRENRDSVRHNPGRQQRIAELNQAVRR